MRRLARTLSALGCLLLCALANATVFSQLQGIVHDPQHRPVSGASITLRAANSSFSETADSGSDGSFTLPNVPLGEYTVTVAHAGFAAVRQSLTVHSGTSPVLHFELQLGTVATTVTVTAPANAGTVTPTTLVGREEIAQTPGADHTNSMAMVTDYVPGAYMTHDMLHMRGGHQVSWLIDGVAIPNTNIASNLAAQVDPKDIDYLEVQRGSYSSDVGDRTYGVFNVVPRTGFERNREGELLLSGGSFLQTDDQISLGDHTSKLAWYASGNGNRSDYGLAPPIGRVYHDATNGGGGFVSLVYNRTSADQVRIVAQARRDFFQIPYDPDPADFENLQYDSSGLRDTQHETDALASISWLHTFNASTVVQVSPFYHYNSAAYHPGANDQPVATTSTRASTYGGGQISFSKQVARNALRGGVYAFGQHDNLLFGAMFHDGSGALPIHETDAANGSVIEEYIADDFQATSWLTLTAGLRQSRFRGQVTEDYTAPRAGVALRVPTLNWVFRGFYGRFYQPPPLLTASGPVVTFANSNNTTIAPLRGERDEEHQFGVQIPLRGWTLDVDTFKTRINNFLDHSLIGDSSIYFPVTVEGARVRAWEVTLRSPRIGRFGVAHLAYSNQIGEQRGNITGGLICVPVGDPACDAGFDYTPLDHDQRNTLAAGFSATLPRGITASANVAYGSGFHNGNPDPSTPYPNDYLPAHTTFDLGLGKRLGEDISVSVAATNVANRRVLLDNSLTFGGFHFNDPRQIYAELRYRFHF